MNLAETLNAHCLCQTLDPDKLTAALTASACHPDWVPRLTQTHPHLFSQTAVYMSRATFDTIALRIRAIEDVMALPAYQQAVLSYAPAIAQMDFGPLGVFMGYDFHLSPEGPRLIEINTNAGGAFLNAALQQAHLQCCGLTQVAMPPDGLETMLHEQWAAMFRQEWQLQKKSGQDEALHTVLIVDDAPQNQYLAPEFDLACQLFRTMGCTTAVADASECIWQNGRLTHPALGDQKPVQLVYNRLTDFALAEPSHMALAMAYQSGTVAFSPNPRAHALGADKRNLVLLSDPAVLRQWGVEAPVLEHLIATIPSTQRVTPENQQAFWQDRKRWFFKPYAGYGSKGTYRGDKLTKGVWSGIAEGGMIAQALVPPSERLVDVDGVAKQLKFDVRAYTYQGRVQLLAARSYAGQTTNFRTEGGGFSPVLLV